MERCAGVVVELGHIACFNSVLDHMCGAQVLVRKGEYMLVILQQLLQSLSLAVSQVLCASL